MTLVRIALSVSNPSGVDAPANGYLEWRPSKRRYVEDDPDDHVVLPAAFTVRLGDDFLDEDGVVVTAGEPGIAWAEVDPSEVPTWAWVVVERTNRGRGTTWLAVPDQAMVEYGTLTVLDPTTLDPDADATAAWYLELNSRIPQGGTDGTVLTKGTPDNQWLPAAAASLPVGGTTGEVLTKVSATDGDADWQAAAGGTVQSVNEVEPVAGDITLTAGDVGAATAAQGATADTAVQPADLSTVATTGDYDDLTNTPTALPPSGGAGGVLSGTYPNPGFSVDMVEQAELTAYAATVTSGLAAKANTADLGTAAAEDSTAFATAAQGATADSAAADLATHEADTANPHAVTKAQVGLGAVDNTADSAKPVSAAQQAALDLKANSADLGTAATEDSTAFATSAQGDTADSAVQPGDLSTVATTGDYTDLLNQPAIPAQVNLIEGANVDITGTYPDLTIAASGGGGGGTIESVNGDTGPAVVLDADDIDDTATTHKYVTAADVTKLGNLSGTNTGDQDLSTLVPKTTTVNGEALSANVTLDAADVGAATSAQGALADTAVQPADLGTAAAEDSTAFATAAQGALADSATQPGDLATVATSGDYDDLTNKPTIPAELDDLNDVSIIDPATSDMLLYGTDPELNPAWINIPAGTLFLNVLDQYGFQQTNNLSEIDNAGTARTNLGLGTAATEDATDFASQTAFAALDLEVAAIDAEVDALATVATTGSYNDLIDKPAGVADPTVHLANLYPYMHRTPFKTGQATTATTLSAGASAAATAIVVTSATGLSTDVLIVINPGTATQETAVVASVAGTTVNLVDPLEHAHSSSEVVGPVWTDPIHLTANGAAGAAYVLARATNEDGSDIFDLESGDKVTFIGNSWIGSHPGWAAEMIEAHPGVTVTNNAAFGDGSAELIAGFDTDVPTDSKYVIFNEPGGNDFLDALPTKEFFANMGTLVRKTWAIGATPVYMSAGPIDYTGMLEPTLAAEDMFLNLFRAHTVDPTDAIATLGSRDLDEWFPGSGGSGDVTAAAAFANDNRLIRSDGTAKGVQASGITISDADVISGHTQAISTVTGLQSALDAKVAGPDVSVADGGTGRSTGATAYGIIAAGTTAAGAQQTITPGTSGHLLKSNGAGALASFSAGSKGDVGLGNVDNTSDATKNSATATLTNKRITKRVSTTASTATLTIASDDYDGAILTAQAAGLTVAAPTGTPTSMQSLVIRIKDNGTARAITWNSAFRAIGVTLPTTTVISKTLYVGAMRNTNDSTWDVLAVAEEA